MTTTTVQMLDARTALVRVYDPPGMGGSYDEATVEEAGTPFEALRGLGWQVESALRPLTPPYGAWSDVVGWSVEVRPLPIGHLDECRLIGWGRPPELAHRHGGGGHPWTTEEVEAAQAAIVAGVDRREVAAALRRTVQAVTEALTRRARAAAAAPTTPAPPVYRYRYTTVLVAPYAEGATVDASGVGDCETIEETQVPLPEGCWDEGGHHARRERL